jgi:hypothetical protein
MYTLMMMNMGKIEQGHRHDRTLCSSSRHKTGAPQHEPMATASKHLCLRSRDYGLEAHAAESRHGLRKSHGHGAPQMASSARALFGEPSYDLRPAPLPVVSMQQSDIACPGECGQPGLWGDKPSKRASRQERSKTACSITMRPVQTRWLNSLHEA